METSHQTWESKYPTTSRKHRVPGRINPRRSTPRHTAVKLIKIKDKDKILKATRGKLQHTGGL